MGWGDRVAREVALPGGREVSSHQRVQVPFPSAKTFKWSELIVLGVF